MSIRITRWEYRVRVLNVAGAASQTSASEERLNQEFNALGEEEWELVGMEPVGQHENEVRRMFCVFKKPK